MFLAIPLGLVVAAATAVDLARRGTAVVVQTHVAHSINNARALCHDQEQGRPQALCSSGDQIIPQDSGNARLAQWDM